KGAEEPPGIENLEQAEVHKHAEAPPAPEVEPARPEPAALTLVERPPTTAPAALNGAAGEGTPAHEIRGLDNVRIALDEMHRLQEKGEKVIILDARSIRTYDDSDMQAKGAIRLFPEQPAREAARLKLPKDAWIVAFCA